MWRPRRFCISARSMGTLTEVDVVTSGSLQHAILCREPRVVEQHDHGNDERQLSINVPTGAIPVTIPSVTETFNASAFDGILVDYGGTSGKDFAPVTSSSAAQATVLTSPADLAAFTGNFRIPITVSGHATGSVTSSNGDLSDSFKTRHPSRSPSFTITFRTSRAFYHRRALRRHRPAGRAPGMARERPARNRRARAKRTWLRVH